MGQMRQYGPPRPTERVPVQITGPEGYGDWLRMLSRLSLISMTAIIRDALSNWAEARGYPPPPKM